jgi:hypothetical protein
LRPALAPPFPVAPATAQTHASTTRRQPVWPDIRDRPGGG